MISKNKFYKKNLSALLAIAQRDFIKLLRDRTRIVATFIFPFLFIAVLGGSLDANISSGVGFNFLAFVFTGVLAQNLFQSTAAGIISLIEDRETDFSQELFITPISRYTIIGGKILGETSVALAQSIGILLFAMVVGVPLSFGQVLILIPAILIACLFGGSFGVLVMSRINSQRAANQIFPFILFPQFFLAGVFNPIRELPTYLFVLSRLAPMTYAVDLVRNFYYLGSPEYSKVVLHSPLVNLCIILTLSVTFLVVGTYSFVQREQNR